MTSFALVICAPSGTGKTTVAKALLQRRDDLMFSVSATTRSIRSGEREGIDYHFVGRDEFKKMIESGELVEWAEVHGELYGTPLANRMAAQAQGKLLILDVDVQGARQIVEAWPDAVTVFLLPPSYRAWRERLRGRASEDAAQLRVRLATAQRELESVEAFDFVVVNERVADTVERIEAIIAAGHQRVPQQLPLIQELRARIREELEAGNAG